MNRLTVWWTLLPTSMPPPGGAQLPPAIAPAIAAWRHMSGLDPPPPPAPMRHDMALIMIVIMSIPQAPPVAPPIGSPPG